MKSDKDVYLDNFKSRFSNLDFSKFEFIDLDHKSIAICKIHGEFETTIRLLKDSRTKFGCSKCANNLKYDTNTVVSILKEMVIRLIVHLYVLNMGNLKILFFV